MTLEELILKLKPLSLVDPLTNAITRELEKGHSPFWAIEYILRIHHRLSQEYIEYLLKSPRENIIEVPWESLPEDMKQKIKENIRFKSPKP